MDLTRSLLNNKEQANILRTGLAGTVMLQVQGRLANLCNIISLVMITDQDSMYYCWRVIKELMQQ